MLYSDSKRRIADITDIANVFKEKGYSKTANEILRFAEILKGNKIPSNFLERLASLFNLCQEEFATSLSIGQDYRKKCFGEINEIVLVAMKRMRAAFPQALLVIHPFLAKLNHGRRITGEIGEAIREKRISDKNVIFHLYLYSYLIIVEGIFDDLARMLYFLKTISKNNIPSFQDLEVMSVNQINKVVKPTPVFLTGWNEKKHIRNAIAHAGVDYDSTSDKISFVDRKIITDKKKKKKYVKITFDKALSMEEFTEKALELEFSMMAFFYTFLLLRIYDLIAYSSPYQ